MQLMAIPGTSGQEQGVIDAVTSELIKAGAPRDAIETDDAYQHSPLGGSVGNLVFKLKGTLKAPRRLLMAHLDTVPICIGCQPVRKGNRVQSADPNTGLGADDRAGVAVVLTAALEILRQDLPHPPLTFFWPVQEEVGLHGARHAKLALLAKPKLAFNWDGGPADKLTLGATGAYRMSIEIEGLASHAGGAPELGVSAIAIAGLAIARLQQEGWHGSIQKPEGTGTSNVGFIQAGGATNVVTPKAELRCEARSHDPKFRKQIVAAIRDAFERAAQEVKSATGVTGKVSIQQRLDYESFKLENHEPCVLVAESAVKLAGGQPVRAITNGGLDANWMTERGIPTVTLGCGQENVHTTSERLNIDNFEMACRVALLLATGTEA